MFVNLLRTVFFSKTFWAIWGAMSLAWFGYSWAFQRGYAASEKANTKEVAELQREKTMLRNVITSNKETAERQAAAYSFALNNQIAAHERQLQGQDSRLDAFLARESKLNQELKNVQIFVTKKADAQCAIPTGFVRLHNLSAAGSSDGANTGNEAKAPSFPAGGPPDADTPTGVTLSTVGSTIASNYSECSARKMIIDEWQSWYKTSQALWEQAVREQGNFLTLPPLTN